MNSNCCCHQKPMVADDSLWPKTWRSRIKGVAGWIVPGTLLALLPKCPMCLVAYVALTGFTMSRASAHIVLRTLTVLCVGTLALCVAKRVVRCCHSKQTFKLQTP